MKRVAGPRAPVPRRQWARGPGVRYRMSCGAPGRGAERALPSADAQNLTTPGVAASFGRCWVMPAKGETLSTSADPTPRSRPHYPERLEAAAGGRVRAPASSANPAHWGTAAIAEMAIAVALAVRAWPGQAFVMPQGGSFSLEMLPILFIAVRRGLVPGLDRRLRLRLRAASAARRLSRAARPGPARLPAGLRGAGARRPGAGAGRRRCASPGARSAAPAGSFPSRPP